ncbi:hypothetical protein [Flavobacterium sp. W21_SRS_FM6]|uniref:hypothetical protein n=1 Tax=Flavobacterium sp. W21_SRS_FM6 TaxID=3240268 RepID=UPI003F93E14F
MEFTQLMEIIGAITLSLGGGAAIVFVLSKWLGNIWAGRIIENEKASLAREHELLIRRRDVYSSLAVAMRIFIDSGRKPSSEQEIEFLKAYDLAALWASEGVINQMAKFLDSVINKSPSKEDFINCITEMRKDCGFPKTQYQHRIVNFDG